MIVARRVYLYAIAFATLWMTVNGLAGLLGVALTALVELMFGPVAVVTGSGLADRVSFYGALTGLGLIVWLIHWGLAARALAREPDAEGRSAIRKLYLYGVLLVGGLILTFQARQLVVDLLGILFGTVTSADVTSGDAIDAVSMLAATGAFWAYALRVVQRDRTLVRESGGSATLRRWYGYILAFVALMLLLFGASGLLARLIELTVPTSGSVVTEGRWLALDLGGRIASVVTGLVVWVLVWGWTTRLFAQRTGTDLERDSVLRKVYLYFVLLFAVSWTVWHIAQMLYLLLRSVLIPSEAGALWNAVQGELGDSIAYLLVFGLTWAYHAQVLKREAAVAPEHDRQASIRWISGYIVSLVGAVAFAMGLGGTLATLLDLLMNPGVSHGPNWWEERLSLFATTIAVGLPVWLIPWLRLQREVVASVARRSLARRIYLFLALGVTVLTLLGSGAFTLYQILRVVLGEPWTASSTSESIDAASAAIVAGLMLAYHLQVFRRDAALAKEDEALAPPVPATPTPLLASADDVAVTSELTERVVLLVVRAPTPGDGAELQGEIQAVLPAGSTVQRITVDAREAARLLGSTPG